MRCCHDLVCRSRRVTGLMLAGMLTISGMSGLIGCEVRSGPPEVQLGDSVITGVSKTNGISAFLGLPFAEPPVGERRWARPIPWQPDGQSIDATNFAPACMQTDSGVNWYRSMMARVGIDPNLMVAPEYSEDCLYLNVWADLEAQEPLPVMILSMVAETLAVGVTSRTIMVSSLPKKVWWWCRSPIDWGIRLAQPPRDVHQKPGATRPSRRSGMGARTHIGVRWGP